MAWVKIDDNAPNHPKLYRAGVAAFGLWIAGLGYCNRYLTDGRIPGRDLGLLFPGTPPDQVLVMAGDLVREGLWTEAAEGYLVHDYLHYQPAKRVVLLLRRKTSRARSAAGRKGGENSGKRRQANREANLEALAYSSRSPVPSRPVPSRETEPPPPEAPTGSTSTSTSPPSLASSSTSASASTSSSTSSSSSTFAIAPSILTALGRCRKLGAVPKLRTADFWQAMVRAYPGVNLPAVILDAEAYLATTTRRYSDLAAFLRNSIKRAHEQAGGSA